jgi:hypothetical protein
MLAKRPVYPSHNTIKSPSPTVFAAYRRLYVLPEEVIPLRLVYVTYNMGDIFFPYLRARDR